MTSQSTGEPATAQPPRTSRREVVARLATAQKSNRGAGGYSRWINRPFGRQLAAVAYLAGLTPDAVSIASAACTYTAIVLIAAVVPTWPVAILIAALLVLGYALDSADGQVARLRGGGSPAGEWLDHVLDAIKLATFHLAIAICWFRHYHLPHAAWLLVPLVFSAVASVFFFAIVLTDMLRRIDRGRRGASDVTTARANPNETAPVLRSLVVLPNDYGVLCLAAVLLAAHDAFRYVYTVLLALNICYLGIGCLRWYRDMRSLATSAAM